MCAKWIGRRLSIGVGIEGARGTGVPPNYWLNATSFTFLDKVNKARTNAGYGGIWGGSQALVAQKWAEGEIEVEMGDRSFGAILVALFGDISSVGYLAANKHTFTLQNDNQHDSLSVHTEEPIGDLIFELSMVDKLTIEMTPEDLVKYTVGFRSKPSQASSSAAAYVSENKFLGRHLKLYIAATTGAFTSTTVKVKRLSITFLKNLENDYVLGTVQPTDIVNKNFAITGEIELNYEDRVFRNYMLDGDYKAMRIDLTNTDVAIGHTNPSFRIDLSKVDFDAWDADHALDNIVGQSINFTALYDLDGNNNLFNNCYLINMEDNYYFGGTTSSSSSTSTSTSSSTSSSSSSSTSSSSSSSTSA